jgi:hypothetical protein
MTADRTVPGMAVPGLIGAIPVAALVLYALDRVGAVVAGVSEAVPSGVALVPAAFVAVLIVHRGGSARVTFVFGLTARVYWEILDAFVGPGPVWQGTLAPRAVLAGDPAALATLLALSRVLATGLAALALAALPFVWVEAGGDGDATATTTTPGGDSTDD